MKIQIEIPDTQVEKLIRGLMENFPEASNGCELCCIGWRYAPLNFTFADSEGKKYLLGRDNLFAAFPLLYTDKWPKGCTPPPTVFTDDAIDDWLCQADANDFDAFIQLALLKEVIYG